MAHRHSCNCVSCCTYPNGFLGILAGILAVISFGLAMFATYACHYVDVDLTSIFASGLPSEKDFGFGLYSREHNYNITDPDFQDWEDVGDNYHCHEWTEADKDFFFDGSWRAARAMGSLSTIFGFFTMLFTLMFPCVSFASMALKGISFCSFMSGLFCFLTLVALSSNICDTYNCTFSDSAGVAIAGGILFFITACVIAMMPAPGTGVQDECAPCNTATVAPGSAQPPAGTVQTSETVLPDGTKKIEVVTYNKDGSKTIQEGIMPAPERDPEEALEDIRIY